MPATTAVDMKQDLTESGRASTLDMLVDLDEVALLLDVDGTLLDIAPRPEEVTVPDSLRDILKQLYARFSGAVAFVSGRTIADIDRIFAPLKLPAVGGHGAEIRPSPHDRDYRRRSAAMDAKLKSLFAEIGNIGPGVIVEDKEFSLALHYRLAPQLGGAVMKSVSAICQKYGCDSLEILPGKAVIEIKPSKFDKGSGLRELMAFAPFAGRRPIFIGDDVTDQSAFAALAPFSGIGCSVGGIVAGATFNFDGPRDVRAWLKRLSTKIAAQ